MATKAQLLTDLQSRKLVVDTPVEQIDAILNANNVRRYSVFTFGQLRSGAWAEQTVIFYVYDEGGAQERAEYANPVSWENQLNDWIADRIANIAVIDTVDILFRDTTPGMLSAVVRSWNTGGAETVITHYLVYDDAGAIAFKEMSAADITLFYGNTGP